MSTAVSDPQPDSYGWLDGGSRGPRPAGFWDDLPTLSRHQVRLTRRLAQLSRSGRLPISLSWLETWLGDPVEVGLPEVFDRASGIKRGGLVAQFSLPNQATRIGIGVEIPLAHAIVDRLLGFDRPVSESLLQLSPVEWGIWTFLFAKALDQLDTPTDPNVGRGHNGPIVWPELYLDRVGPDPFDPDLLGKITTICWTSKLGSATGTVRLWLPESVVDRWLRTESVPIPADPERIARLLRTYSAPPYEFSSDWRARGGSVPLPRGLKSLRIGGVLPINREHPDDTARDHIGRIELVLDLNGTDGRLRVSAQPAGAPGGKRLAVTSTVSHDPSPIRETPRVNGKLPPDASQPINSIPDQPPNLPVTLTVELGRVNLTLSRLADLKPGDIVELNRHNREPVELTSNGRLVARGELVKIDTEIGVRVTNVFL